MCGNKSRFIVVVITKSADVLKAHVYLILIYVAEDVRWGIVIKSDPHFQLSSLTSHFLCFPKHPVLGLSQSAALDGIF